MAKTPSSAGKPHVTAKPDPSRPPAILPATPMPSGQSILRRALITLAVVAAAALVLYAATRGTGNIPAPGAGLPAAPVALTGKAAALDALAKGQVAAFVASGPQPLLAASFVDGAGKPVALSDFRGKVVLLNLWATWCAPCRKEMPMLDTLQKQEGGDRFAVVALNMDRGSADKAKIFLEETKVPNLALYHDPSGKLGSALGVVGMPTTILIGADGRELGRLVGPAEWDSPEAIALVKAAL